MFDNSSSFFFFASFYVEDLKPFSMRDTKPEGISMGQILKKIKNKKINKYLFFLLRLGSHMSDKCSVHLLF